MPSRLIAPVLNLVEVTSLLGLSAFHTSDDIALVVALTPRADYRAPEQPGELNNKPTTVASGYKPGDKMDLTIPNGGTWVVEFLIHRMPSNREPCSEVVYAPFEWEFKENHTYRLDKLLRMLTAPYNGDKTPDVIIQAIDADQARLNVYGRGVTTDGPYLCINGSGYSVDAVTINDEVND